MNEFVSWCRHLLVSFIVHALTSLHPPSFHRNDFSTCIICLLMKTCSYTLQYFKLKGYGLTVVGLMCTITSMLIMTDWQAIGSDPCTEYSLFHHPGLADQYRVELAESNISESGMVSVQSLQVVEGEVYQMAVNRCESAGEHCHWIPNSLVTSKHCSDCQPICRSTSHALNFIQFTVGFTFYASTAALLYIGIFILVSNSVSNQFKVSSNLTTLSLAEECVVLTISLV